MAKCFFRLKNALSYESMGAPKDRKKGQPLSLYRFSGKDPVAVTNPVDQEHFRAKKELLIECREDGTPIFEANSNQDYGSSFAGRALSFQRYALGPKFVNNGGAVSANTPGAPVPPPVKTSPVPNIPQGIKVGADADLTPTNELQNQLPNTGNPQSTVASTDVKKSQDKKTGTKVKVKKEKKFKCRGCGKAYTSRSGRLYHEKRCPIYAAKFANTASSSA